MAKSRLPQVKFISKVTLAIGRIIVETKSGKERGFPYEQLTEAQEIKLRAMADPLPKKQTIKVSKSRSASLPRKRHNYAAEVARTDVVFVSANGQTSVMEVKS